MRWDITLRAIGIIGIVASLLLYTVFNLSEQALIIVVSGILSIIFPEMIDRLPWGPAKPK